MFFTGSDGNNKRLENWRRKGRAKEETTRDDRYGVDQEGENQKAAFLLPLLFVGFPE